MFDTLNEYRVAAERHYQKNGYTFDKDNLSKIVAVMNDAFTQYSRVFAFRVDFHFEQHTGVGMYLVLKPESGSRILKAFFSRLKWLIDRDESERRYEGKRVHSTEIRYVWAREQTADAPCPHYHMMIFLNRDAYYKLGNYESERMNLANKIRVAWHSAVYDENINLQDCKRMGLVHFPENAEYLIERNDTESLKKMLVRAAYLAKSETKRRGERYRCFGGSNI
ncbi:inovirus Gp2 family protein [Aeromonas sp. QDB03]|uniref:inovirus Gp2 family protein n=1 Tax=Aeromonas sp. QDB03 TaxID=2989839 RepID=UPI0022E04F77|nr:inovirus Gp2 family protein [Aeromonas sp. QDB03]